MDNQKIPPNSQESEQALLGGLMLDNTVWDDIADILIAKDFYHPAHATIFSAISNLVEHSQPADVLTVREYLQNNNQIDNIGGFEYLADISANTPSIANIKAYAQLVRELSTKRALIQSANDIVNLIYKNDGSSSSEILDIAESKIFNIAESITRNKDHAIHIKDAIPKIMEKIQHAQEFGISAIKTGFSDLDNLISGLHSGDLIIIAGRPSMGKTAFAMNIVENIAIHAKDKKPVAVFSLEMSYEQIVMRMVSAYGGIDAQKLRNGNLDDEDWNKITKAMNDLDKGNIIIDETPSISPLEIRAKCRRIKRQYPDLAVVVVDYLQLMNANGNIENRVQEISQISRSLKALARELNVPIIALSQLNRSVESRGKNAKGRMPQMSDLRESGAIEQDADIIAFIYRDEVYHDEEYNDDKEHNKADIKIAKHRNGPIGIVKLAFQKEFARFANLAKDSDTAIMPTNYQNDTAYNHNKDNFINNDTKGVDNVFNDEKLSTDDMMFDPDDM